MDLSKKDTLMRSQLEEFLEGGFAPVLILLREFDYKKAHILLDGLHFSAWILLGHMRERQSVLLNFMRDPKTNHAVWEEAIWPENYSPRSQEEWNMAVLEFNEELEEMKSIIRDPEVDIFKIQSNGKSLSWAALAALHHNAYHIGQLKTIGRQLGVW